MHFSVYQHKCASTNVLLALYNSVAKGCFIPWMDQFLNELSEPVIQRSMRPCPKWHPKPSRSSSKSARSWRKARPSADRGQITAAREHTSER